jgi:predicted N-acyltransferase
MRTPPKSLETEVIGSIAEVAAEEWNALVGPSDPFTEHGFLLALEQSGSVGKGSGWQPVHVLIRADKRLIGAAPLYLKQHSYGEYIFDWGWAEAAHQAGVPYYPKLTCAVPFTPATGRRLLTGPGPLVPAICRALLSGMRGVANATQAQSIHLLFMTQEEHTFIQSEAAFIPRTTHQFHWHNTGYADFEHWLEGFRSRRRKEVRRERRAAVDSGAQVAVLRGPEITAAHWAALRGFYEHTVDKKGAHAYLQPDFFHRVRNQLQHSAVAFIAEHQGRPVAGALAFQRGEHLYGRYWGCQPGWEHLHFELCIHQPIEQCITHGWSRFEAGAQGVHKVQRGLMPASTWSAHQLAHPGLHRAVVQATVQEGEQVRVEMEVLARHGPFRRG